MFLDIAEDGTAWEIEDRLVEEGLVNSVRGTVSTLLSSMIVYLNRS